MKLKQGEAYWDSLLVKKEKCLIENFGMQPYEAIGLSEAEYLGLSASARYGRVCTFVRENKHLSKEVPRNLKTELETFKSFMKVATPIQRESLLKLMNEAIGKSEERRKIEEDIRAKKKELFELEKRYKTISL
jgi:hypothetical protein